MVTFVAARSPVIDRRYRRAVLLFGGNSLVRPMVRLVDAAHILPVGAPGSADDVRNGIVLSLTYHRAFDNGLIFLDDDLRMKINPAKQAQLANLRPTGGIDSFKAPLGRIHLPPDRRQWPSASFIAKANRFRQIAT